MSSKRSTVKPPIVLIRMNDLLVYGPFSPRLAYRPEDVLESAQVFFLIFYFIIIIFFKLG